MYIEWAIYGVLLIIPFFILSNFFIHSSIIKNLTEIIEYLGINEASDKILFFMCLKITILLPIIFLIISLHSASKYYRMRGELEGDTAIQWEFYDKVELELKELKNTEGENSDYYKQAYKAFLDTHIALRSKTNTELMQDILQKQPKEKTLGLKQISEGLDVIEKAKNIVGDNKNDDKEGAKNPPSTPEK